MNQFIAGSVLMLLGGLMLAVGFLISGYAK